MASEKPDSVIIFFLRDTFSQMSVCCLSIIALLGASVFSDAESIQQLISECQELEDGVPLQSEVGGLLKSLKTHLSSYWRKDSMEPDTVCFYFRQPIDTSAATITISQLSETTTQHKAQNRYLQVRLSKNRRIDQSDRIVLDTKGDAAFHHHVISMADNQISQTRDVYIIHVKLADSGSASSVSPASSISPPFGISFLISVDFSQTNSCSTFEFPTYNTQIVSAIIILCISAIATLLFVKKKTTTTVAKKSMEPLSDTARPIAKELKDADCNVEEPALDESKTVNIEPPEQDIALQLKLLEKKRNNRRLTVEEEKALGYLEEAEEYYKYLEKEDSSEKLSKVEQQLPKKKNFGLKKVLEEAQKK